MHGNSTISGGIHHLPLRDGNNFMYYLLKACQIPGLSWAVFYTTDLYIIIQLAWFRAGEADTSLPSSSAQICLG
jgi:hypothetical protein